jgi:hypothetical protein
VEIRRRRFLLLAVALGNEQDDLVFSESCLDGGEGRRPPHEERNYHIGEYDDIPKREDRNAVRRRDRLIIPLKGLRHVKAGGGR